MAGCDPGWVGTRPRVWPARGPAKVAKLDEPFGSPPTSFTGIGHSY